MIDTLLALFAAHLAADFLFQTPGMVARKREPRVFALHISIVAVTAALFLGGGHWAAIAVVTVTHAAMDWIKVYRLKDTFWTFVVDQAVHLSVIVAVSAWSPTAAASGVWALLPGPLEQAFYQGLVLFSAAVLATKAGGVVIGRALARYAPIVAESSATEADPLDNGLPDGGLYIGWLERGLILVAILAGQPEAVGLLLTAKSILRFPEVRKRTISEYVIIGTLMSFGWAALTAVAAKVALGFWA